MQPSAPSLCKPVTDPSAYCAVVADACEFNRGLTRRRASRLPFLDSATQILQKPAPWLYRELSDRTKDSLDFTAHGCIRYNRFRWTVNPVSPAKRRRLTADRLWYNLQTILSSSGITAELYHAVAKKAFAWANLPVPTSLASHLEPFNLSRNSNFSTSSGGLPMPGKLQYPAITRRDPGSSDRRSAPVSRDDSITDEISEELPSGETISHTEDSLQSTEGIVSKRTEEGPSVDVKIEDEGAKLSAEGTQLRAYELDDESDDIDDPALTESGVGTVMDDETEDFEEDDLDDDDDDVEWVQPRGRRSAFERSTLSARSHRRRGIHCRRGSSLSVSRIRFSDRRLRGRHFQATVQEKLRTDFRTSDVSETSAAAVGARRGGRIHSVCKIKTPRLSKERESSSDDHWFSCQEPGFQPNSLLSMNDRDYPDPYGRVEHTAHHPYSSEGTISTSDPAMLPESSCNVVVDHDTSIHTTNRSFMDQTIGSNRQGMPHLLSSSTVSGVIPSSAVYHASTSGDVQHSSTAQSNSRAPYTPSALPKASYRESFIDHQIYASNRHTPIRTLTAQEQFATPPVTTTATTTVTFFVCEVCASRYRSTAGLRYHYHSQHSGYTPKNPISASASRLVVPVGEERGIGGGLRGGRPRRHKVTSTDVRNGRPARASDLEKSKTGSGGPAVDTPTVSHSQVTSNIEKYGGGGGGDGLRGQLTSSLDHASYLNSGRVVASRPVGRMPGVFSADMKLPVDAMYSHLPNPHIDDSAEMQRSIQRLPESSFVSTSWATQQSIYPMSFQPSYSAAPSSRMTPSQRRLERQRCPDRVNPSHVPIQTAPCCVYCLGDDRMNPHLGRPEGLLRCSRCATWAHFSCLHLPNHVIDNAMRYPWQCIDCKSCWLCGSPEQESRMIFCGDCDRVFHVDCLPVPLSRLPAHWSCDICLHDLYSSAGEPRRPTASDSTYFYP